jgi:uncharacterized membrane protein YfcA
MLLIAEIILTIFAWRAGWKWLALLPLGIFGLIGFLIGLRIGALGGTTSDISWAVIFDVIVVIILIVMIIIKRKKLEDKEDEVKKV